MHDHFEMIDCRFCCSILYVRISMAYMRKPPVRKTGGFLCIEAYIELWKQPATQTTVRCCVPSPLLNFIRKVTVCLLSSIPICADRVTVCMVIFMKN